MRTTLSLDDDVAVQLERLRAKGDKPFKQIVNDLLRAALAQQDRPSRPPQGPFTRSVSLGRPRLPDVDDVSEALAIAEGDRYR